MKFIGYTYKKGEFENTVTKKKIQFDFYEFYLVKDKSELKEEEHGLVVNTLKIKTNTLDFVLDYLKVKNVDDLNQKDINSDQYNILYKVGK